MSFGKFCTGAHTDLEKFIKIAVYGFTERLGLCPRNDDSFEVVKPYRNKKACTTQPVCKCSWISKCGNPDDQT
ncbi:hypothetical protein ACP70R_034253 [Stipagrostis hirtigluma subsp. patula]